MTRRVHHLKRGTTYDVLGEAEFQTSAEVFGALRRDGKPLPSARVYDGDKVVVYRGEDGKLWARPVDEFEDGRFEDLPPAAPVEDGETEGRIARLRAALSKSISEAERNARGWHDAVNAIAVIAGTPHAGYGAGEAVEAVRACFDAAIARAEKAEQERDKAREYCKDLRLREKAVEDARISQVDTLIARAEAAEAERDRRLEELGKIILARPSGEIRSKGPVDGVKALRAECDRLSGMVREAPAEHLRALTAPTGLTAEEAESLSRALMRPVEEHYALSARLEAEGAAAPLTPATGRTATEGP